MESFTEISHDVFRDYIRSAVIIDDEWPEREILINDDEVDESASIAYLSKSGIRVSAMTMQSMLVSRSVEIKRRIHQRKTISRSSFTLLPSCVSIMPWR